MTRAVVMRAYGPPSVLKLEDVPRVSLAAGEIRVRSLASAINHSDLEIRAGSWPILRPQPFPYVPGLEVVGEVIEAAPDVTSLRPGDRVITMMQGLGGVRAERDGGYAEEVVFAADAAAPLAPATDARAIAALGLAAITAYGGLLRMGPLAGKDVAVTGAAGGVGSAGVALARAMGARVTAIVSRPTQADYVRSLGAAEVLTAADVDAGRLAERSLDGLLDNVGGPGFFGYVASLRAGGTLSLVGAVAGAEVRFDAYRLTEVALTGYSSESLHGAALRPAIAAIEGFLGDQRIAPPEITPFPLAEAAAAHEALEQHRVRGRLILV